MHRAMKYRFLDSEYYPCSFRDKGATKLNDTVPNLQIAQSQSGELVSARNGR